MTRVAALPFDHTRRATSALVDDAGERRVLVVKGAPEQVLAACADVPDSAHRTLDGAVRRRAPGGRRGQQAGAELTAITADDEAA